MNRVPRLMRNPSTLNDVRDIANVVRNQFGGGTDYFDIELFTEDVLGMVIIPTPGLLLAADADAALLSDGKHILVDQERMMNPSSERRFRFSLAHEVGHKIMHMHAIKGVRPRNLEDLSRHIESLNPLLETQANEFAGHLLAPPHLIMDHFELYRDYLSDASEMVEGDINSMIEIGANLVADKFQVSIDVVSIRIRSHMLIHPFIHNQS